MGLQTTVSVFLYQRTKQSLQAESTITLMSEINSYIHIEASVSCIIKIILSYIS
jgi:hypothetical protein